MLRVRTGRVLIVEDEGLVAMAVEQTLTSVGYDVVGPAPNTKKALKLIAAEVVDAALLDVNLGGERIDSVAQALAEADVPFAFCTGYSCTSALPPGFHDRRVLKKPFHAEELLKVVDELACVAGPAKTASSGTVRRQ